MDIVKIARKLEPLMPKEVQHWLRIRDTADPELRSLVEKQIASTAHRVQGDFHKKILLSLPPPGKARGTFNLGTVLYDKPKWSAGISASELLQNMAIFGQSGAGKTNVVFHLLLQLINKRVPFLFLDWKRTARHLLPKIKAKVNVFTPGRSLAPFPFNPFIAPPGLEPRVYINHMIDVLSDAFTLGDGARSMLERALGSCYAKGDHAPTLKTVLSQLDQVTAKDRARGWKLSATRALQSLAFSEVTAKDPMTQERLAHTLLHENTIIELDALSEGSKKFLVPLLSLWLYYVRLAAPEREQLSLVIVVEEAHHVLYGQERRSREGLMNMLLRQCREIGIAMIVVDQHPSLLSSAALGNTFTSVCLSLKTPSDINKAAGISMIQDTENKMYFSMLPVGQAIVKMQNRWRWPFLVQVPRIDVKKGAVTDTELIRYLRRDKPRSARNALKPQAGGQVPQIRLDDHILDDQALVFLKDICAHPDDGVKARYKRMGMSGGRGNRIKEELIEEGWLQAEVIPVERTRKTFLRLTPRAKQAVGAESAKSTRESIAHAYWKQFYAHRLRKQGYEVMLEAPRTGGQVDVLASRDGERLAIELETGKSGVVANVRNDLHSGFKNVIVVATDKGALTTIERELAAAGLIIPGRVQIVLRDRFREAA